jgi:signal peptidase I
MVKKRTKVIVLAIIIIFLMFSLLGLGFCLGRLNRLKVLESEKNLGSSSKIDHENIVISLNQLRIINEGTLALLNPQGISMNPGVKEGNVVLSKPYIDNEPLEVGDIIIYETTARDNTIAHRIVEIGEEDGKIYYRTKGDNNLRTDKQKVLIEDIRYVQIGVIY